MRAYFDFRLLSLFILVACAHAQSGTTASTGTPNPFPLLIACNSQLLHVDGVEVSLITNVDGSLASASVVTRVSELQRTEILGEVERHYGEPHPDTRVFSRPWKWGLVQTTDPCGRLVAPHPIATP